jgi:hypothetical protein
MDIVEINAVDLLLRWQGIVMRLVDLVAPHVEELHGDEEDDVGGTEADEGLVAGVI